MYTLPASSRATMPAFSTVPPRVRRQRRFLLLAACYAAFVVSVLAFGGHRNIRGNMIMSRSHTSSVMPRMSTRISTSRITTLRGCTRPDRTLKLFATDIDELNEEISSEQEAKQKEIERLRAAEKFFKKGTGTYECTQCQFVYNPQNGDPEAGVLRGTEFQDVPEDWLCPVCGADKQEFEEQGKIVAGFAENQGYGFGTNSMTEGQKSALIYGSLLAFFALFLLGYKMN